MVRRTVVLLVLTMLVAACGNPLRHETDADRTTPPKQGACRNLDVGDLGRPSNADAVVPCSKAHTAETFVVGTLPEQTGSAYDDRRHGSFVFDTCSRTYREFLGVDESLALRIQLSWAWFRPSKVGWDRGARWYRCDVVGGTHDAKALRPLPAQARGMFGSGAPEAWLTCARGATVAEATKVPCSERHDWRAVTAVKIGQPQDPYPGDRVVEVRSRDYCSDWVGAWTHYQPDYKFGYTWFRDAEWATGNRRSVCWARTDQ